MGESQLSWKPIFLSDLTELNQYMALPGVQIVDTLHTQLTDFIKTKFVNHNLSKQDIELLVQAEMNDTTKKLSQWIFYPWRNQLVHILNENDFIFLRTNRNMYKVTPEEQNLLAQKKVGIVGLSVGSSVALAMTLERGYGEIRLADFDTLDLSNLNRIPYSVASLGIPKVVLAARAIFELDPYLQVKIFENGLNAKNIADFFQDGGNLDLVVDECDSIDIKILIRHHARQLQIPTVMETSDRGLLDIERFDLEPDRDYFHGRIGSPDPHQFSQLTTEEKIPFILKIAGIETASIRAKASLLEIEQTIKTWPQLGSAIFQGGGVVAEASRRILLNEGIPSGRHHIDLTDFISKERSSDLPSTPFSDFLEKSLEQRKSDRAMAKIKTDLFESTQNNVDLTSEQWEKLMADAGLAPSAGNSQPWILIQKASSIFLWKRSFTEEVLSTNGQATAIGLGACIENLRLAACVKGLQAQFHIEPNLNLRPGLQLIGRVNFKKSDQRINTIDLHLSKMISLRTTDRAMPTEKFPVTNGLVSRMESHLPENLKAYWLRSPEQIEKMAALIGAADRIRLMGKTSHKEFTEELRFTDKDAALSGDGIDLASFHISAADQSGLEVCKSWSVMDFLKKWNLGWGLTKFSSRVVNASSAVVLLTMEKNSSAENWIEAGEVIQRIWLEATGQNWNVQPMTALIYLMNRVEFGESKGLDTWQINEIKKLKQPFSEIFDTDPTEQRVFLFRLSPATTTQRQSFRHKL